MTGWRLSLALPALLLPLSAPAEEVPPSVRTAAACAPVGTAASGRSPRVVAMPAIDASMPRKTISAPGDRVALDRTEGTALAPGDRLVVRRPMRFAGAPEAQHTIGWLRVTEVTAAGTVAQVETACTAIATGDIAEPGTDLILPPGATRTFVGGRLEPHRSMRVSYGTDGRSAQADRDFVLADRDDQPVAIGERYAAFHRGVKVEGDARPVAEAVVVAVFPRQALLRVTQVHDAVFAGDRFVLRAGASDPGSRDTAQATAAPTPVAEAPARLVEAGSAPDRQGARPPDAATAGRRVVFEDVLFALNRDTLRPEARRILDGAVVSLQNDPTLRVRIEGHTCDLGTAEYNLALGQRRADAVRAYLVMSGVAEHRLTTVSVGEEQPAHDNATKAGRQRNRRAVLSVNLHR